MDIVISLYAGAIAAAGHNQWNTSSVIERNLQPARHLSSHLMASPLHEDNRYQRNTDHQRSKYSRAIRNTHTGEHIRKPEGTNKAPSLPDYGDENTDAPGFGGVAVNRVSGQNCSYNLIVPISVHSHRLLEAFEDDIPDSQPQLLPPPLLESHSSVPQEHVGFGLETQPCRL